MPQDGPDYSIVAAAGQVNVTHILHAIQHEDGGIDEINVQGLSGKLADPQNAGWLRDTLVSFVAPTDGQFLIYDGVDQQWEPTDQPAPIAHATSHQNGGSDEINVQGLSGVLADKQDADKLQGRTLADTAPTDGQAVVWDAANAQWKPGDVAVPVKLNIALNPEAAIFPSSNFPALYKVDGTNFSHYEARFDDASDEWLFFKVPIPASYAQGNLKVTLYWKAAATTGDVVWSVAHYDRAAGEVLDTTATEVQSVTDTVEGTSEYINTCFVTFTTHPADNDLMILKVMRDADNGADTMSGDAKLLSVLIEEQ